MLSGLARELFKALERSLLVSHKPGQIHYQSHLNNYSLISLCSKTIHLTRRKNTVFIVGSTLGLFQTREKALFLLIDREKIGSHSL